MAPDKIPYDFTQSCWLAFSRSGSQAYQLGEPQSKEVADPHTHRCSPLRRLKLTVFAAVSMPVAAPKISSTPFSWHQVSPAKASFSGERCEKKDVSFTRLYAKYGSYVRGRPRSTSHSSHSGEHQEADPPQPTNSASSHEKTRVAPMLVPNPNSLRPDPADFLGEKSQASPLLFPSPCSTFCTAPHGAGPPHAPEAPLGCVRGGQL